MYAIVKRNLGFRHPDATKGRKILVVTASRDPQQIPDWVKKSDAYPYAIKDRSLVEVIVQAEEVPVKQSQSKGGKKDEGLGLDDNKDDKEKSKSAS